jgi:signal peptidase I
MSKRWLFLIIPVPLLFIAITLARLTGALQIYSIPTPSSEPTIKMGAIVYASNLKKPVPGNTVAYKSEYADTLNPYAKPGEIHLHRMIADEGDIIEMKDGVCFVNKKNFDADKNLLQGYMTDEKFVNTLPGKNDLEKTGFLMQLNADTYYVFLATKEADAAIRKGAKLKKIIEKPGEARYTGAFAWMKKDSVWTIDNFGPLEVPNDCYFILGDNRHNALDSRYVGFVKKENFRGTVLITH